MDLQANRQKWRQGPGPGPGAGAIFAELPVSPSIYPKVSIGIFGITNIFFWFIGIIGNRFFGLLVIWFCIFWSGLGQCSTEPVKQFTVGGVKSGICRLSRALCGARCVNMKQVKSGVGPG